MKAVYYSVGFIITMLVVYRNQLALFSSQTQFIVKKGPLHTRTEGPLRYNIGDNKRDAVCLNFK